MLFLTISLFPAWPEFHTEQGRRCHDELERKIQGALESIEIRNDARHGLGLEELVLLEYHQASVFP